MISTFTDQEFRQYLGEVRLVAKAMRDNKALGDIDLPGTLDEMADELERLRRERDAYRDLADGQDRILVGYRTGRTPAGGIDKVRKARERLSRLAEGGEQSE